MSIQLPSDLILDVVKAADPQKAQAMASRLKQASAASPATLPAGAMSFDAALATSSTAPAPARALPMEGLSPLAGTSSLALRNATALSDKPTGATPAAYRRFESMVLSGFVDSILPEAKASLFGSGTAGQVWRSMLAERIADEVAKHGGVGLAERIAGSATRGAANAAVQSAGLAGDTTGVRS